MADTQTDTEKWWMSQNWGLFIGVPFTILVVGLLIYGNFFGASTHVTNFVWEFQPELHICDTAPKWARPGNGHFDKAIDFWKEHGWEFSKIEVGPCPDTCGFTDGRGEHGEKTCVKGKVALDLMDQWFDPEHAGVCSYPESVGNAGIARDNDWVTITLPEVIFGSEDMASPLLPADVEALVAAHEIGHCLVGLGHNEGPSVGCGYLNSKTGSLMNPNVYKGGWVDEGLPTPPEEWEAP